MLNDAAIIALLQKRDEKALLEIRQAYGGLCFQTAYRILGSRGDAEECVSDMLIGVWNSIPPDTSEGLCPYLLALVRRSAVDCLRRTTCQKRGGTQYAAALDEIAEIIPSDERTESQVERREVLAAVTAFLRGLPERQRQIFMLRYYAALPVREIAGKLGMTPNAVKLSLMRTRQKLKEDFRKKGLL